MLGNTSFTVHTLFFVQRRECDVCADGAVQPRSIVIVPLLWFADVYMFITSALGVEDGEKAQGLCVGISGILRGE